MSLFVDQQAGRLAVMTADAGEPVADLTIPPIAGKAGGGVRIGIVKGEAALDSVQVSAWRGGELQTVPADRIEAINFPVAAEEAVVEKTGGVSVQVTDLWGRRRTGSLLRVEQGTALTSRSSAREMLAELPGTGLIFRS